VRHFHKLIANLLSLGELSTADQHRPALLILAKCGDIPCFACIQLWTCYFICSSSAALNVGQQASIGRRVAWAANAYAGTLLKPCISLYLAGLQALRCCSSAACTGSRLKDRASPSLRMNWKPTQACQVLRVPSALRDSLTRR